MMDTILDVNPDGLRSLIFITALFALGLLFFTARILTRVIPVYRLNATDYVSAFAVVLVAVAYSLFVTAITKGLGQPTSTLTIEAIKNVLRYSLFVRFFGTAAATVTRFAIALQLLRFSASKWWKAGFWGIVTLEVATLIAMTLYTFLQASPISNYWNDPNYRERISVTYIFLTAAVIGDLWCSIMPLFLIWDLSRSRLERIILSILMTLGLCSAGVALAIIALLSKLKYSEDVLEASSRIYTWCLAENCVLLVYSSAPLLKGPIEKMLRGLGFQGFHNIPRELNVDSLSNSTNGSSSLFSWGRSLRSSRSGGTGKDSDKQSVVESI